MSDLAPIERLTLRRSQLSEPASCHLHAVKHWTRIFVGVLWAKQATVGLGDKKVKGPELVRSDQRGQNYFATYSTLSPGFDWLLCLQDTTMS